MDRFARVEKSLNALRMLINNYAEGLPLTANESSTVSYQEEETENYKSESAQSLSSLAESPRASPRSKVQKSPQQEISAKFEQFLEKQLSKSPQSSPKRQQAKSPSEKSRKSNSPSSKSSKSKSTPEPQLMQSSQIDDYISPGASDNDTSSTSAASINSSKAVGYGVDSDNAQIVIQLPPENKGKVQSLDTTQKNTSLPPVSPIPKSSHSIPSFSSSLMVLSGEESSSQAKEPSSDLTPIASIDNIIETDPQLEQFKEKLELSFQARSPHSVKTPKSNSFESNYEEEEDTASISDNLLESPNYTSSESKQDVETHQLELPEEEESLNDNSKEIDDVSDPELEALKEHLEKTSFNQHDSSSSENVPKTSLDLSDPFRLSKILGEYYEEEDITSNLNSSNSEEVNLDEKLKELLQKHDSYDSYEEDKSV